MEQYVALYYSDGYLGKTILCQSWQSAVDQCVRLAKEAGEKITAEQIADLETDGECRFPNGGALHIGGLEGEI